MKIINFLSFQVSQEQYKFGWKRYFWILIRNELKNTEIILKESRNNINLSKQFDKFDTMYFLTLFSFFGSSCVFHNFCVVPISFIFHRKNCWKKWKIDTFELIRYVLWMVAFWNLIFPFFFQKTVWKKKTHTQVLFSAKAISNPLWKNGVSIEYSV